MHTLTHSGHTYTHSGHWKKYLGQDAGGREEGGGGGQGGVGAIRGRGDSVLRDNVEDPSDRTSPSNTFAARGGERRSEIERSRARDSAREREFFPPSPGSFRGDSVVDAGIHVCKYIYIHIYIYTCIYVCIYILYILW